ncbi:tripartite tricarboxylate transporter substrate binding protein [Phyllobacterium leguminum]|uniref:Tripartite-type tricarboxylate transporter receptor subunit TctC n=1 Tax=Phyllobacterium leguminum TaxID=314237 RepID=A0A318T033_9HYPH|nr:tripartite tricarboxylate transporter substrate binding protein [Phyllobacterium leguminum]PYE86995.1 tripartite-type tricarboxylate transporter receptor subunit TctC [Phyllobacterium leguminum]
MSKMLTGLLCLALPFIPQNAFAQVDYPVGSVRIIVPANPGGGTDAAARIFADYFQRNSDAVTAVVNQAAGGGVVAAQTVSTANPDGATLLFFHAAFHTANLSGNSPFKWDQFTPIATVTESNEVYAVRVDTPYNTLADLIAAAKANPNTMSIGTQLGGTTQVKAQALNAAAGNTMRIVDAGTESDRVTALLGGQIDVISMSVGVARQYVKAGQMKALAVMNKVPDATAPEIPTTVSQGVDISLPLVQTVYGPKDMDPAAIAAIEALIKQMGEDQAFKALVEKQGQTVALRNATGTSQFLSNEYATIQSYFTK